MRVEFSNPEFPSGLEFDVGGLKLINGEAVELTEEDIAAYEARNSVSVRDSLSSVQFIAIDGQSFKEPEASQVTEPQLQLDNTTETDGMEEVS
jgi:hypothetical protein